MPSPPIPTVPNTTAPCPLAGRIAVITGASRGIGRAMAIEFAHAGAAVALIGGRNEADLNAVAAEIRQTGGEALPLPGDLADERFCQSAVAKAWQWRNGVHVWINNAGADVLTGPAAEWSFQQKLQRLWEVDVLATVRLARDVGQRMKQAKNNGVILNMGWDQAEHGMAGDAGEMFGTIKGAVIAFTRSLAQSLAPEVRVHALAPGWIRTAWGTQASTYWDDRARRESLRGRWGEPEDVARVALFLASDAADFLTGQIVPINGGFRRALARDAE